MTWRWVLSIVLGLLWLLVAGANAQLLRDKSRGKYKHNPSPVVFLGGIFAFAALALCPWKNPLKWLLLIPALALDLGSGIYIAFAIGAASVTAFEAVQRTVARASWIKKIGIGFLVWYLLFGGALSQPGDTWVRRILIAAIVVYWPLLLAWFWWLRKHSPQERGTPG